MPMTEEERREASRAANRRYYSRNQEKMRQREKTEERRAASREWARRNPEKVRNNFLRRRFGITLDTYRAMAAQQCHKCTICGKSAADEGRDLAVDHDHRTGRVRGLLCTGCNTDLAVLEKCPDRLARMLQYLTENKTPT